ncbi:MAG: helix-turn-helix transcriptional regulator [Nitrospirae bacterium]|nr:helix-turn-helix transcriptional regulator [Magnetococcales bacterium]
MQAKKSPPILSRVEDYLKNNENKFVADKIGVAPQTVSSWKKRGDMPSASAIEFAERESLSLDWLLTGRGPMRVETETPIVPHKDGLVYVAAYSEVVASAGTGAVVEYEFQDAAFAFQEDFIRDLRVRADKAAMIRVIGDSMTPTLSSGDWILVDRKDEERFTQDAVYVFHMSGELFVKRIHRVGKGQFKILSDNPVHPPLTPDDTDLETLRIIGRVVWAGRRM